MRNVMLAVRPDLPIGARLPRPATRRAIEGRGRYLDDITLPGLLHVAFVRSPFARAAIGAIDAEAARQLPGVVAVITGADIKDIAAPWRGSSLSYQGFEPPAQRAMALGHSYFHGEAVAAVVAVSREIAEDGVELIKVAWTEETPTPELAAVADAPPAHSELASNVGFRKEMTAGNFAEAATHAGLVVEEAFTFARQTAVPPETRGLIADYNPADQSLTVHHSHQMPNEAQANFGALLGIEQHRIRVINHDVGGGFGIKLHLYPDEVATVAIAKVLGRPIKYIADRRESLMTDIHARENRITARLAVGADGRILGFDADVLYGLGPYSVVPRTSVLDPMLTVRFLGAAYDFEHFHATVKAVYQNRPVTGQYRGVGVPVGIAVTERLIDKAAARLGIDPAEFRRRNLMAAERMPVTSPAGLALVDLSHHACLDRLLALMKWDALKAERDALRRQGIHRGLGLAVIVEPTAPNTATSGPGGVAIVAVESATIKIEPSGHVRCLSGTTEQGQGTSAGITQIAAAALGVPADHVSVLVGDTAAVPITGGAAASRGLVLGGEAAWQAGRQLRQNVLDLAAALLQKSSDQLDLIDGRVIEPATGEVRFSLRELAEIVYYRQYLVPEGVSPQFAVSHQYHRRQHGFIPCNSVQASYVEVDAETGQIKLLGHWAVADFGRVVNPLLVDEQLRGGIVQGIGSALYEAFKYDDRGRLLNNTLASYALPMAPEMPDIGIGYVETPYSGSELGAKGVGEAGICGAGAAVLNAVNDALSPLGAGVTSFPMTPAIVLKALGEI
jgi:carbon-monoxide dehydrogenase large subunit